MNLLKLENGGALAPLLLMSTADYNITVHLHEQV